MPIERTLPKPLSGAEIIEAVVSKVRAQMQRDCFLSPHLAYASFSFQADIRIQFQNTQTSIQQTNMAIQGQGGEITGDEMQSQDVHVEDEPKPPNQVRVETGQGVPALVPKPTGGVEERKLKYAPRKNSPTVTTKQALTK